MSVPSLDDLKRSHIQIAKVGDQINLYYVCEDEQGRSKKTPLHVKTGIWTCPFGRDDQGKLVAVISDSQYFQVAELDRYGRDVCKYFLRQEGKAVPEDPDELPYKSLVQSVDGMDVIHLHMSAQTRVFDNNNVKLQPEQVDQWTSGQFSGNFLLSLGLRIWTGNGDDGTNNGKFYWSVQPVQIKIRRYCTLPEGCKIFEDENELKEELDRRTKVTVKKRVQEEEPVADFDPDVNELLD